MFSSIPVYQLALLDWSFDVLDEKSSLMQGHKGVSLLFSSRNFVALRFIFDASSHPSSHFCMWMTVPVLFVTETILS